MRLNYVQALFMLGFSILLAACGSGSGGDSGSPPTSSAQTYTASATAGEILTYTIDPQNKTYSYKIIHSAYGLDGATGSGTLVINLDGSYSPSTDPNTKVHAIQNGLLIGTIHLELKKGVPLVAVPIMGVSQPITSQDALAGTYNFVGIRCLNQTFGVYTGCESRYGIVEVDRGGNYIACPKNNLTTPANGTLACNPSSSTGTMTSSLGDGIWDVKRNASTNISHLLAFAAPNGQKVMILDLNDSTPQTDPDRYGYGFIVMSTQTGYDRKLVDGTWYFQTNKSPAGPPVAGSLTVDWTQISSSLLKDPLSANFDVPWTGLASISSGGYALLAGTGAYAYVDPASPGYLELGMKK